MYIGRFSFSSSYLHIPNVAVLLYICSRAIKNYSSSFPAEDDLSSVYSEVLDLTPNWMAVGLTLGLQFSDLETISTTYHESPHKCFMKALALWLKQAYNSDKNGLPTWKKMVEVTGAPGAGNNPALAARLARNHQGMLCVHALFCYAI